MIYGPYPVSDLTQTPTVTEQNGVTVTTYPLCAGVHYTTTADFYAAHPALEAYRVNPTTALQNVMAGDDPANPVHTIPLRFPDAATAQSVIEAIIPPPEPQ